MVTRRRSTKDRRPELSEGEWLFLIDDLDGAKKLLDSGDIWALTYDHDERLRSLWQENGEAVMDFWWENYPGTRPRSWWRYEAPRAPIGTFPDDRECFYAGKLPAPRLRVGGTGETPWDAGLAYVPVFDLGIPTLWETFDEDNPPTFESQPSYLERHGLLTSKERKRLGPRDFDPEPALQLEQARRWYAMTT